MIASSAVAPLPRYIPWSRAYIPFALAAILLVVDMAQRGGSLGHFQVLGIANSALPLALVGMGEAIVILTNGIDLSVGAIIGLATGIVAVVGHGAGILGIVAALAAGGAAGLVNGLLVSFGRMASLIVTLATGSIFGGCALLVLPSPGGAAPAWLYNATVGSVGVIPVAVLWLAALVLIGWLLLRRTSFGIYLQCLGSSEAASWSAGVPTRRTTLLAYMSSGLFAALAGVTLAGLTGSGDPNIGNVYILNAIAVVVVGGTDLFGGRGTLSGTVFGAIVLSLVSSVLFASGLSTNIQYIVTGGIVIAALLAQTIKFRRTGGGLGVLSSWLRRSRTEQAS